MRNDPPEITSITLVREGEEPRGFCSEWAGPFRVLTPDGLIIEIVLGPKQEVTITRHNRGLKNTMFEFDVKEEFRPKGPKIVRDEEPGRLE